MKEIVVLGMGGHAESVVDTIERAEEYHIAGFVINETDGRFSYMGYPILGKDSDLEQIFCNGIRYAVMGIGFLGKSMLRSQLCKKLINIGFSFPVIMDPSSVISRHAQVDEGCFIGKGAILNAGAKVGKMSIINTQAVIEHDCCIGAFSHVAVGSVLCGNVCVGELSLIGANATVIQNVKIGNRCIVGAGTTVKKNLEDDNMLYSEKQEMTNISVRGGAIRNSK